MHEKLADDSKCQVRHDTSQVCVQYKSHIRSWTNTNEQVYSVGVSLRSTIFSWHDLSQFLFFFLKDTVGIDQVPI